MGGFREYASSPTMLRAWKFHSLKIILLSLQELYLYLEIILGQEFLPTIFANSQVLTRHMTIISEMHVACAT